MPWSQCQRRLSVSSTCRPRRPTFLLRPLWEVQSPFPTLAPAHLAWRRQRVEASGYCRTNNPSATMEYGILCHKGGAKRTPSVFLRTSSQESDFNPNAYSLDLRTGAHRSLSKIRNLARRNSPQNTEVAGFV